MQETRKEARQEANKEVMNMVGSLLAAMQANNRRMSIILYNVLDILDNAPVDAEQPYKIIGEYIERLGLEYVRLLALANNYYNRNTILQLAHVAGGR